MKTVFKCSGCTYTAVKWLGCCPTCKAWDSFSEVSGSKKSGASSAVALTQMKSLPEIDTKPIMRIRSGINEWDRVTGEGIVHGSLLILTGDPGIGKSTLLLQISNGIAHNYDVFYFSTEESLQQVKLRAQRLRCSESTLFFSDQAHLLSIIETAKQAKPTLLIIDSIQNCYLSQTESSPGSIGQLREAAFLLMRLAKKYNITVIISGHITKEGIIAGPKTLEHMVDGVFYLQGDDRWKTRLLRSVKNRFGTINELGFFEMSEKGLQEVPNINQYLVNEVQHAPGSVLVSIMEGSRPLLLDVQALCIESKLTIPQRVISGIDHKQVVLVAAILEKYLHVRFSTHDIFVKVGGGFKAKGSSIDLGIACALLSSYFQQALPEKSIVLGELSLTGTIKPVNSFSLYIKEAEKFGIKQIFVAKNQQFERKSCTIKHIENVYELLSLFNA